MDDAPTLILSFISQISARSNRTLEFCNNDRLVVDNTKQYELRRERFEGDLDPDQVELMEQLETEQVSLRIIQRL